MTSSYVCCVTVLWEPSNNHLLALFLELFKTLRGKLEVRGKHSKNNLFCGRFSPRGCLKSVGGLKGRQFYGWNQRCRLKSSHIHYCICFIKLWYILIIASFLCFHLLLSINLLVKFVKHQSRALLQITLPSHPYTNSHQLNHYISSFWCDSEVSTKSNSAQIFSWCTTYLNKEKLRPR